MRLVHWGGTVVLRLKMVAGNDGASLLRIVMLYKVEEPFSPVWLSGEIVMLGIAGPGGGASTMIGRVWTVSSEG